MKNIEKFKIVLITASITGLLAGCSSEKLKNIELNPYKADADLKYYKDVGVDEDELQYKKEITSEDGASSTLYHKTIQLPDKKISLRKDPVYMKYESIINDTDVQKDGNNIDVVYAASYSDITNSNIIVSLNNDDIVLTTFYYINSDTLRFTCKNFTETGELNLDNIGLTVYLYDESGDVIGVYQPQDTVLDVADIDIVAPTIAYTKYIGFATGMTRYDDYYNKLSETSQDLDNIRTSSGQVLY